MVSEHAEKRWGERTPAEVSLEDAWEDSFAVEAPETDSTAARLYPPYDALLVVKHTTLTTVLNNDGRLSAPHLSECASCGDVFDPVEGGTCPWCGEDSTETPRVGCVTITRGGF